MKHICLSLITILLSITTNAQYTLQPNDITVNTDGFITACHKNFSVNEKDIIIPETINGITIVGIKDGGCKNGVFYKKGLTSVQLPTTLRYIGQNAFAHNPIVGEIDFRICPGIEYIGNGAFADLRITAVNFSNCSKLTTINYSAFADNLELIGGLDLSDCNALTTINNSAFVNCSFSSLVVHSPVLEYIGASAFTNNALKIADLSGCENLMIIGSGAFANNELATVNLSNCTSLNLIGAKAFENNKIISMDFRTNSLLQEIEFRAFNNNELTSINFKDCSKLTTLGYSAFENNKLTSIDFSGCNSLSTMGNSVFKNNNLTTIVLSDCTSLSFLGTSAFESNQISTLTFPHSPGITGISKNCFKENNLQFVDFTSLPNLVNIESQAFEGNRLNGVQNLFNHTKLEYIGNKAFANNVSIGSIILPNVSQWMASNMQTYAAGASTTDCQSAYYQYYTLTDEDVQVINGEIVSCSYSFERNAIIIPNELDGQQITGIANTNPFEGKKIHCLKLPANIVTINEMAFAGCSMEIIDFSDCTALKCIEKKSFYQNSLVQVIGLKNCSKLNTIGNHAFFPCSTSLILPQTTTDNNHSFGWALFYESKVPNTYLESNSNGEYEITNFRAKYLQTYSVIFNDHDGAYLGKNSVALGLNAKAPVTPKYENFIFKGWTPDITEITDTLSVKAQYIQNYESFFIFKLLTTSGEPILYSPITMTSDYEEITKYPNGSGIASFYAYTNLWNYSIGGQNFYENIYGQINDPSTIVIDTLNILRFQKPVSYLTGDITLNNKEQKFYFEQNIYVPNGEYHYTINTYGDSLFPDAKGIISVNNNDISVAPYHLVGFTVKTSDETLLSNARIQISELGISSKTNDNGFALFYLPSGDYTYSVSHSLFGVEVEQRISIEDADYNEEVILYPAIYTIKNNQLEPYTNASLTTKNGEFFTNSDGVATTWVLPGWFKYRLGHSQIVEYNDSIQIENEEIHEYININKATFTLTANGSGISGASIVIGNKTLTTNDSGSAIAHIANGSYEAIISHPNMRKDSTISVTAFNDDLTIDLSFHKANFIVTNSDDTAYKGAVLSIYDTKRTIPQEGLSLYLPLGQHLFEISHAGKLGGKAQGSVISRALPTNHVFTVYKAMFNLKTTGGLVVDSNVTIDGVIAGTNNDGVATIKLFDGKYVYGISNNAFSDNIEIDGADIVVDFNGFYTATFTTTYPNGTVFDGTLVNINHSYLYENASTGNVAPSIDLPSGSYPYTVFNDNVLGSRIDTLHIIDQNPATVKSIISPVEFSVKTPQGDIISDGVLKIDDELYLSSDIINGFDGIYDYSITHPLIKDTLYSSLTIDGAKYIDYIQKEEIRLYELVILEEGEPLTGASFYKGRVQGNSAIEIPLDGSLYFSTIGTYLCEVYQPDKGGFKEYLTFESGKTDTLNLMTLVFNSNSLDSYLVVNGDTLSKNSSIRNLSTFLRSSDMYNYKIFYKNGDYMLPLDSGTVSTSNKVITQNIHVPTYAVVSNQGQPLTNASLITSPNNHAFKETDFIHRVVFKENVAITCTIRCNGYKDTTFIAHNDDLTRVVVLTNIPYHTVTFIDWDGTVLSNQTIAEGSDATEPDKPVREGYTFIGWDIDFTAVTSDLTVTAQYTLSTGIKSVETKTILIYPNPSKNTVTITLAGDAAPIGTVAFINLAGKTVYEISNFTNGQTIDISHLPKGIYFVKAGNKVEKMIKE